MLNSAFRFVGLLTLAASLASAQNTVVSAPFTLQIISASETLNGSSLVACHEGAGIEGLCATPVSAKVPGSIFNLNTTSDGTPPNKTIGQPGVLTYELQGSNFNVSEPMALVYNPTSNVAVPFFEPGYDTTEVAFDDCEKLNIQGFVDDTKNPAIEGVITPYYRWYICTTVTSYTFSTLSWVVGSGEPENPTCQKVDIIRVF